MPERINVVPVADESFGVRSMCTYVETADVKILLDAGTSLAPNRMGYPPHPKEYHALAECRERIVETAEKADVVTISHYHFDHHTPSYVDWFTNWSSPETAEKVYNGKVVITKSFRSRVNASQRRRGWMFTKTGGEHASKLETADGRAFRFGETLLSFSEPVFHGPENTDLGWVVMATIDVLGEKVVCTSDVQGPVCASTLDRILVGNPRLVFVGGPPTYLAGFRVKKEHIEAGVQNMVKLVEKVPTTILGHHTLRDENWRRYIQPVFDAADDAGNKVLTAAEFVGKENNLLEFRRRQLFETEPPSNDFKKWVKLPLQKRKLTKPPV